jgi:WD40 repeat protein
VAFSPDGKTLVSGSGDNNIIMWNAATRGAISKPLLDNSRGAESVTFSPNGKIVASGGSDGTIRLWNAATGERVGLWTVAADRPIEYTTENAKVSSSSHLFVESVAFSPDGKMLAAGTLDGSISLWDVAAGKQLGKPLKYSGEVRSVKFSRDGKVLASGGSGGKVILWDVAKRQQIGQPLSGHPEDVYDVAFSPDGKILASVSCGKTNPETRTCGQGEIRLWNVDTHQPLRQPLAGHTYYVTSIAFSPDGKLLASGSGDSKVILWNVTSGKPIGQPLDGHTRGVNSVAFSPHGKILASGSDDHKVILWDVATGKPLTHSLVDPYSKHQVNEVAFSPDGKTLASALFDGNVILWDVSIDSWQGIACSIANRNLTVAEWNQSFPDKPYSKTCPDLPVDSTVIQKLVDQAKSSIQAGNSQMTSLAYKQAAQWAIETDEAQSNNLVCWFGSIDGFANYVLPACDRAVALAPHNGGYRDSRGVARTLTGDYRGAIEDFKSFVKWLKENDNYEPHGLEREAWIAKLKAGENPLDAVTLKAIRNQ